ncbi:sulfonate transport system permease protein [Rhodoblastus sphagnicola]|nr:ABC transporter permease [Rhodoblastus sphagnicola]MBB4199793.1 sulfonate transport system permease protein [Rhodoblastus sphagnicola]
MNFTVALGAARAKSRPGAGPGLLSRLVSKLGASGWRPWLAPLAALLVWEIGAHLPGVDARFLPSLEAVAVRGWRGFVHDDLFHHVLASLGRDLAGFVLGACAGVSAGLVLGFSPLAQRALGPTLMTYRQISLFAWIPLVSMWFGGNEAGKIAFIAMAAFQPTLVNSWRGVAEVPKSYRELSNVLLFGRLGFVWLIALPCALPQIFTGLHSALICAWAGTVGAELLFNIAPGIGGQMNEGQQLFQMDRLLLCILLLGGVGLLFNLLARAAERRLLRWRTL